ncbi:MAG TPA: SpoIIE family protein phosphatase [Acidobacteriaceae bacterium]|nr:SpoIIE family protein phosphatase [Acidobacteriaceae bacterium]
MAVWRKSGRDQKRDQRWEEQRTMGLLNIVVALAVAAVAYTDWVVIANISLGYLYMLPVALSGLINPLPITVALAVLCTVLQDIFGPPPDSLQLHIAHNVVGLAGFLVVGFLVTLIAKQRDRLAVEVRQQRDAYERDLILASHVQMRVLPKPPTLPGFELAAVMHPARLLGGDYYDFFKISEDVMDVVIADVSGKGAAAALLMPSLALALRSRARELSGPGAIVKDLDEALKQITNSATFATIFYARLHAASRTLEYTSGGHNPPLLVRTRTGECRLLTEAGPIVGILPDAQFTNTVVPLEAGDFLTLFTDGVTEQEDERGEEFSMDRLQHVILRAQGEPASTAVGDIADAVSAYAGAREQTDDLTVVVLKVL